MAGCNQSVFFVSRWSGYNQAISVLIVVWFIRTISVQEVSLREYTTLHHDCSVIVNFSLTQDKQHVLFWLLILNIMIAILACTSVQASAISQVHDLCTCFLLRSRGCSYAAEVAAA